MSIQVIHINIVAKENYDKNKILNMIQLKLCSDNFRKRIHLI